VKHGWLDGAELDAIGQGVCGEDGFGGVLRFLRHGGEDPAVAIGTRVEPGVARPALQAGNDFVQPDVFGRARQLVAPAWTAHRVDQAGAP